MGLSTFVGSLTVPAGTGNQAVTGVGFQPKLVFFFGTGRSADGAAGGSTVRSPWWGVGISSSSRVAMTEGDDGVTANNTATDATKCIKRISGSTTTFAADLVSLDADGFTVNFTTANATAYIICFMALGGSDLTNVAMVSLTSAAATGNQATTGMGFQPDALLLLGADNASANNSTCFGIGKSSTARGSSSQSANATTGGRVQKTDKVYTNANGSNSIRCEADLVTLDSDGFTLNWTTANAATHTVYAIGLKGGRYNVGAFLQKTSTGSQAYTGVGFQATGVLGFSTGQTAAAGLATVQYIMTAAASGAANRANVHYDAGSSSNHGVDRAKVYSNYADNGTPTLNAQADFTSFDADGFTLNYGTADATAREVIYLAMGDAPFVPPTFVVDRPRGNKRPFPFLPGSPQQRM